MAELWDAYDRDFTKIQGKTLVRGLPVPEGCYHLVCEVCVKHTDGTYLIMKRDPNKTHGGKWELTAGGSAIQGEEPYFCAVRELREETGITSDSLTEIGRVIRDDKRTLYVEYFCVTSCDKDSVVLQEGETVDYKWITREELFALTGETFITRRMTKIMSEMGI